VAAVKLGLVSAHTIQSVAQRASLQVDAASHEHGATSHELDVDAGMASQETTNMAANGYRTTPAMNDPYRYSK
jgi:hypothetical protein